MARRLKEHERANLPLITSMLDALHETADNRLRVQTTRRLEYFVAANIGNAHGGHELHDAYYGQPVRRLDELKILIDFGYLDTFMFDKVYYLKALAKTLKFDTPQAVRTCQDADQVLYELRVHYGFKKGAAA